MVNGERRTIKRENLTLVDGVQTGYQDETYVRTIKVFVCLFIFKGSPT